MNDATTGRAPAAPIAPGRPAATPAPPATPAPAATPPNPSTLKEWATPVAEQAAALSPEQAKTRLSELNSDSAWREKLIKNWARDSSAEKTLFDALTKRMADLPATPQPPEQTEAQRARAALEPPEKVDDYRLVDHGGRELRLSEADEPVVRGEVLPVAREMGLSQGDVELATYAVLKPMTFEQCENHLHKVWGRDFDARADELRDALKANPRAAELVTRYADTLGNNAHLLIRIVEAWRRRAGRK